MSRSGSGWAPGKAILLGEHAVVYGHPALAAALPWGVRVDVETGGDGPRLELPGGVTLPPELLGALGRIGEEAGCGANFRARVTSEVPLGAGLGSSAALGVALARACCAASGRGCEPDEAARLALLLETVLHGAPSGVDPAVCARGGTLLFRRGRGAEPAQIETVRPARPLSLVVAATGVRRGTRSTVLPLSARRARQPAFHDQILGWLGQLALEGRTALERGDLDELGLRFDAAHGLLSALGVSCPELDAAVLALRQAGALGAKLTGAGGGGVAIGLARDLEHAQAVAAALSARGLDASALVAGREGNP